MPARRDYLLTVTAGRRHEASVRVLVDGAASASRARQEGLALVRALVRECGGTADLLSAGAIERVEPEVQTRQLAR